jgi:hypothetical protein
MRQFKVLVLLAFAVSLSGCTVPTTYTKSIAVKKDANGKVIETVETEAVIQPGGQGYPVRFEHLKGVSPWENPSVGSRETSENFEGSAYEYRRRK